MLVERIINNLPETHFAVTPNYIADLKKGNLYIDRLNFSLKTLSSFYRWCVVSHKDDREYVIEGLFTPQSAIEFLKKIRKTTKGYIYPHEEHDEIFFSKTGAKVISSKISRSVVYGLIDKKHILCESLYWEGLKTYQFRFNLFGAIASAFMDNPFTVSFRDFPENTDFVWFDLTEPV